MNMTIKEWQEKIHALSNARLNEFKNALATLLSFEIMYDNYSDLKVVIAIVEIEMKNRSDK
jgi:hypothetical protein